MQKTLKVFLFAGQSNMVGSDAHAKQIDDYPLFKGAGAPQADVRYTAAVDGQTQPWGPLQPLRAFGPELTFARLVKQYDRSPLAILKSAVGGTTAADDWNPDAPEKGQKLYPKTLAFVRKALHELEQQGLRYQLEGVVWHQGENDMLDRRINTQYAANLRRVIQRLRADLDAPQLKWYLGEVSEKGIWGMDNRANLAILRQQQDALLVSDPLLRWVPTSHLAFAVMNTGQPHYHFGTLGQLQLGEAFARAYLKEIKKGSVVKAPPRPRLPRKAPVRLFVLAGQRNMEGEEAFVAAVLPAPQANVLYRYWLGGGVKVAKDWEPLGPVDYLGTFGPELGLGAGLRKAIPEREGIALVKFTHSGAQGPDWSPQGSPESRRNLYPRFIGFVKEAVADLQRQGHAVTVEAVFWHPGENDAYFGPYARNTARWFQELLAQFRHDLDAPELPAIVAEHHPKSLWPQRDAVNADLRQLAATDPRITLVPTAALPLGHTLYEAVGTQALGEALAQAYLRTRAGGDR